MLACVLCFEDSGTRNKKKLFAQIACKLYHLASTRSSIQPYNFVRTLNHLKPNAREQQMISLLTVDSRYQYSYMILRASAYPRPLGFQLAPTSLKNQLSFDVDFVCGGKSLVGIVYYCL